ncbi:VOC family protein [Paenibacillus koleovorans]|uniref:VOC family protein n=1 Tax=Paenibacillus koleovorans TaxID=121608 RepID=UPI000FD8EFF4|nr:VOC family protein [Paenibacillus koleovorans]
MTKELWLNLPVKDVQRSKQFFTSIGFALNPRFGDSNEAASLLVGEKSIVVMLVPEATFRGYTNHEVADTKLGSEVLISIDAESRDAVDELLDKVEAAGGTIYGRPSDRTGWMYGAGFVDLDGHRWNVLYMDMSQMPQG